MMVNGKMIKGMAEEFGLMENKNMKENISMGNNMVKELGLQKMGKNMKENGQSTKGMVLVFGLKD